MTHYLIYYQDNQKNDLITIKDTYKNKNDAQLNLEKVALEHVKKIGGEKQGDICKQTQTLEQITNNLGLRDGLYIIKQNDVIILCEKMTKIISGTLWNGYKPITEQIGVFGIIEYKIDDNLMRCECSTLKERQRSNRQTVVAPNFLDELKKMIDDTEGKFNLKNVRGM
jgi:hypothetical protein